MFFTVQPIGRPSSQQSNGEDALHAKPVGAKVSQLAHLFQSRSREDVSTLGATSPVPASPGDASPHHDVSLSFCHERSP